MGAARFFRPAGAVKGEERRGAWHSQGVALGCYVRALQARRSWFLSATPLCRFPSGLPSAASAASALRSIVAFAVFPQYPLRGFAPPPRRGLRFAPICVRLPLVALLWLAACGLLFDTRIICVHLRNRRMICCCLSFQSAIRLRQGYGGQVHNRNTHYI